MSKWPRVRLGDVAMLTAGNPAPQDRAAFGVDGTPFIRMQDVGRTHVSTDLRDSIDKIAEAWPGRSSLRLFPAGSILIPKSGASINLNHRALLGIDAYVVSHLAVVIPDRQRIDPEYLFWWSVGYDPRHRAQVTSLPSLPLSILNAAELPLPPLPEQRRIVDILNRAAGIRRLRRHALEKTRALIPALFVEIFGDPGTNPKGWRISRLGEHLETVTSGSRGWSRYYSSTGARFIRVQNISSGVLDLSDVAYVTPTKGSETRRSRVQPHDLLISITGNPGMVAVAPPNLGEAYVSQHVAIARLKADSIDPRYVAEFLADETGGHTCFLSGQYGQTRPGLGLDQIRSVELPVPPLELQRAFVTQIVDIHAIIAQQERMAAEADALMASLMNSLLNAD